MQLFIDSADPREIKEALSWGYVDGVTTNPSLAAKVGRPYKEIVEQILKMVGGPVSLETIAEEAQEMVVEAKALAALADNVYVKVPCTREGFKAVRQLKEEGVKVNMTLCFSLNQALIAAKIGADFVSPFIGRIDDISEHGGDRLVMNIRQVYDNYGFKTKILDASIRDVEHIARSAIWGADIATVPFELLKKMSGHKLTDAGLKKFLDDWKESGLKLPV